MAPMENHLIKNIELLMLKKRINSVELANATHIPQPTISRILNGTSETPRTNTLSKIADYFEVSLEELCNSEILNCAYKITQIPIIKKSMIESWINSQNLEKTEQFIPTAKSLSKNSFALEYKDNISIAYFKQKSLVMIFDPLLKPQDGDIILIKLSQIEEIILRQIIIDATDQFIKSLNPELHLPGHLNKIGKNDKVIATLAQVVIDTN